MDDFTAETTPFSAGKIGHFGEVLRSGTTVFVTCLPGTDYADIIAVSKRLRDEGMRPVPHIAARSVPDKAVLDEALRQLVSEAGVDEVFEVRQMPAQLQDHHVSGQVSVNIGERVLKRIAHSGLGRQIDDHIKIAR